MNHATALICVLNSTDTAQRLAATESKLRLEYNVVRKHLLVTGELVAVGTDSPLRGAFPCWNALS
jgi:hypothetical protein